MDIFNEKGIAGAFAELFGIPEGQYHTASTHQDGVTALSLHVADSKGSVDRLIDDYLAMRRNLVGLKKEDIGLRSTAYRYLVPDEQFKEGELVLHFNDNDARAIYEKLEPYSQELQAAIIATRESRPLPEIQFTEVFSGGSINLEQPELDGKLTITLGNQVSLNSNELGHATTNIQGLPTDIYNEAKSTATAILELAAEKGIDPTKLAGITYSADFDGNLSLSQDELAAGIIASSLRDAKIAENGSIIATLDNKLTSAELDEAGKNKLLPKLAEKIYRDLHPNEEVPLGGFSSDDLNSVLNRKLPRLEATTNTPARNKT